MSKPQEKNKFEDLDEKPAAPEAPKEAAKPSEDQSIDKSAVYTKVVEGAAALGVPKEVSIALIQRNALNADTLAALK